MLVSSSGEPAPMHALGKLSTKPEEYGVDVLFRSGALQGWCGVQRKEVADFVGSVHDGRLGQQVAMMQTLKQALVVIEGQPKWTTEGELWSPQTYNNWTMAQHFGMLWSIQRRGIWVVGTQNVQETVAVCRMFASWCRKKNHKSLWTRPAAQPSAAWGDPSNYDYQVHLVSSLPGVGPELAARIIETCGLPFQWCITIEDLLKVQGIGKVKAERIYGALKH